MSSKIVEYFKIDKITELLHNDEFVGIRIQMSSRLMDGESNIQTKTVDVSKDNLEVMGIDTNFHLDSISVEEIKNFGLVSQEEIDNGALVPQVDEEEEPREFHIIMRMLEKYKRNNTVLDAKLKLYRGSH